MTAGLPEEWDGTRRGAGWLHFVVGVAVFLAGFNMRASVVAVMPVIEILRLDLGANRVAIGLLTTIPVLLMGVFAPMAPVISRRLNPDRAVACSLALIGIAAAARFWGGAVVLFATAALLGFAIAIGQPLVMSFAKAHYATRVAVMAGIYAAGVNVGAAVAAQTALPVYELTEEWRASLGVWFLPALLTAVLWLAIAARGAPDRNSPSQESVWRDSRAWTLASFFGITVFVYYGILTWLAPLFVDRGLGANQAAAFLSLFALFQLPGTLLFPWLAGRRGHFGPWLVITVVATTVGLALAALDTAASPWLITMTLGIGTGGLFPLCLALPAAHARDPQAAASLSAMAFTLGYVSGALGPSLLGWLRDAHGNFFLAFMLLASLSIVQLALVRRVLPSH